MIDEEFNIETTMVTESDSFHPVRKQLQYPIIPYQSQRNRKRPLRICKQCQKKPAWNNASRYCLDCKVERMHC